MSRQNCAHVSIEQTGIKVDGRNARASIWDMAVQFHSYMLRDADECYYCVHAI